MGDDGQPRVPRGVATARCRSIKEVFIGVRDETVNNQGNTAQI